MPVLPESAGPTDGRSLSVTVSASAAIELHWVTASWSGSPVAAEEVPTGEERAGLQARLAALWAPDPDAGLTAHSLPELLVLADRAGVLSSSDLGEVVAAVAEEASRPAPRPALRSEVAADRDLIAGRLVALARSARRRREWRALLDGGVAAMAGQWEAVGVDVARRTARARTSQLPWSDPSAAIVAWAGRDYGGALPDLIDAAARSGRPVLVVPAYWSGRGLLFDLEEHLLVGIQARPGTTDSRARVEPWARRLKAMADPTRLAILDHVAAAPRTVTELAADFALAQPTVSRHVRLLRDAGLITDADDGERRVRPDQAAIGRLLAEIGGALVDRPEPAGQAPEVRGGPRSRRPEG